MNYIVIITLVIVILTIVALYLYKRIDYDFDLSIPKSPEQIDNEIEVVEISPPTPEEPIPEEVIQQIADIKKLFLKKFQIPLTDEWIISRLHPGEPNTTLHLARELYRDDIELFPRLLVAQYICNRSMSNNEILGIYEWVQFIANNNTINRDIKANAIDILKLTNNPLYMIRADNILRAENRERVPQRHVGRRGAPIGDIAMQQALLANFGQPPRAQKYRQKTIYKDTQTVHNHAINESVLNTMQDLQTQHAGDNTRGNFQEILNGITDTAVRKRVNNAYNRIQTDSSTYRNGMSLPTSFNNLLQHIDGHEHKEELQKRLVEEMSEMSGMCATGHLARMANTLQGFEENRIKVDPQDEIYAKLSHVIQQRAQEDEAVMDMLMDPGSQQFTEMVNNVAEEILPELHQDYGTHEPTDITTALEKSVQKYTNV